MMEFVNMKFVTVESEEEYYDRIYDLVFTNRQESKLARIVEDDFEDLIDQPIKKQTNGRPNF